MIGIYTHFLKDLLFVLLEDREIMKQAGVIDLLDEPVIHRIHNPLFVSTGHGVQSGKPVHGKIPVELTQSLLGEMVIAKFTATLLFYQTYDSFRFDPTREEVDQTNQVFVIPVLPCHIFFFSDRVLEGSL